MTTNATGQNRGPNSANGATPQAVLSAATLTPTLFYPSMGAAVAGIGNAPRWIKVSQQIPFGAFALAGTTASVPIFVLPGNCIIEGIFLVPRAAFAGPSISAYTLSVGILGTPALFASAYDVTKVSSTQFQLSSNFWMGDYINPTNIYATATSTGANLSAATSGAVDIYAKLSTPSGS